MPSISCVSFYACFSDEIFSLFIRHDVLDFACDQAFQCALIIKYSVNKFDDIEYKLIMYEFDRSIRPKGIVYIVMDNGKEIKGRLTGIAVLSNLKENWYYYEEMAGV